MENFSYCNPVNVVFGKNSINELPNLIPVGKKVLLTYGRGSIKKNGVYDSVINALKDYSLIEFSGIESNPSYEKCMEAVKCVKENKIDFLLAVGGGSVLDGTKFISAASNFKGGDPWDIIADALEVESAIPIGCVMTLPATGSEMDGMAVLTRKSTSEKLTLKSPKIYPFFSIIDPETTYSLPARQLANGLADSYIHVLEQYITCDLNTPLQDRQAESILETIREIAKDVLNKTNDYDSRASFCWCASQALSGLINCGVVQDWATHKIGHEITAFYGLDHAQSLVIVLPRLWESQRSIKAKKMLQYGKRVLNIDSSHRDSAIDSIIKETKCFFESLDLKTSLSDYGIDPKEAAEKISTRFKNRGVKLGEKQQITPGIVKEILLNC
jgi:NADP-dependent alcohol dehydrogenase